MGPDRRWMGPGPGWPRSHGPLGPWGGVPGPYGRPGYGPPPWSWPPRPGPVPGRPGIHDAWRRHPHDREMGGRLAQRLHLTPEQRARLGEELRSHRDELRDLRAAVQAGKFDSADARVQARDIRTDLEREVKRILTPQQFDQMQKIRQERMKHRIDRRLENLGRESGRRIEFLTRVLGLSDSQASQIKEIAQSSLSDRRHVLEQLRDGKIEDAQAADQMRQIREQEISRVRELLNPDQKERFEALRKLAGPRHSQRPGPGRSPRWG